MKPTVAIAEEVEEVEEEFFELEESLSMANPQIVESAPETCRELLVIEDEVRPGPAIVSSKCFRQLFSSLESANRLAALSVKKRVGSLFS